MTLKQISLTLPENLLAESKQYSKAHGYRNLQELIVELVRNKVIMEKVERYESIKKDMILGKNVKKFRILFQN